jgi:hypothetical protein
MIFRSIATALCAALLVAACRHDPPVDAALRGATSAEARDGAAETGAPIEPPDTAADAGAAASAAQPQQTQPLAQPSPGVVVERSAVSLFGADGARRWAREVGGDAVEAALGDGFVAVQRAVETPRGERHELVVLDAADGHELAVREVPWIDGNERFFPVATSGDRILTIEAAPGRGGVERVRVVARDARTGSTVWSGADHPVADPLSEITHLVIDPDGADLHVCTPDGFYRRLDAATGVERWSYGVESCHGYARRGDGVVFERQAGPIRPTDAVPLERVTVTGRMVPEVGRARQRTLVVGDRVVRTDASGRFRVTIEARGSIVVRPVVRFGEGVNDIPVVAATGTHHVEIRYYETDER